jgi:hypothetical protein
VKERTDSESERHPNRKGKNLRVIEIRYVPTPDAQGRLSRAINILLRSAATDPANAQEPLPADAKRRRRHIINDGRDDEA